MVDEGGAGGEVGVSGGGGHRIAPGWGRYGREVDGVSLRGVTPAVTWNPRRVQAASTSPGFGRGWCVSVAARVEAVMATDGSVII